LVTLTLDFNEKGGFVLQNHIKNSAKYLVSLSLVALISACGVDRNTGANSVEDGSSQLAKATVLKDMNNSYMLNILKAADINATNAFGYENAFGYKSVKITYNTVGQDNKPVVASGLLVIPTISEKYKASLASIGKNYSVSMICDNHGTIFTNAEAPTNVEQTGFYPLAVSMSAYAGFAGIYPDYIGYGDSNDVVHPYMLKKASARSAVDMIKASMKYMEEHGVILNHQLYVSGYSQGGYNALATAESIEKGALPTVTLKGVAPMAGPYLLKPFGDAILATGATMSVPAFMGFLADSYAYYNDNLTLDEMLVAAQVPKFNGLFNGDNNATVIHTTLGLPLGAPSNMLFNDTFISDYENNATHKLKTMFDENTVGKWDAKSKIKLIQCSNDDVIPVAMTYGVKAQLETYGSNNVEQLIINDVNNSNGDSIHSNCAKPAYTQAVGWFDAIRQGIIK